ncbi:SRPBCC family protein [Kribbella soli]|uniref:SRPBCC family protein n=1 Tax=Kribbella soli TaxID=1124743 RepID=A0A4R0GWQ9_9ACTN|nr:SRPBCC family protein [Kribbella soli]TCC01543.1 SRPBCC family protein [Kribbella soli]
MSDHEASTTIDVAPNILWDQLSDLDHLAGSVPWLTSLHRTAEVPTTAQGPEARQPHQAVHEDVDVTVGGGHRAGWIDVIDEDRVLRWGMDGPHEYHGELIVDFVADGTSKLTVRVHTIAASPVDDELERTLSAIKATVEHHQPTEA